ncbi:MAG: hypothetical protein KDD43_17045 [Bdellovibrionales bacterium]|nr:hypothetical protein [Bdellovibrionales bacterium]
MLFYSVDFVVFLALVVMGDIDFSSVGIFENGARPLVGVEDRFVNVLWRNFSEELGEIGNSKSDHIGWMSRCFCGVEFDSKGALCGGVVERSICMLFWCECESEGLVEGEELG